MRNFRGEPKTGVSFGIPDLMIARAWAEYHGLHLEVQLDRRVSGDPCEEVLAFEQPAEGRRWTMWRSRDQVVVCGEGIALRFPSLPEALDGLGHEQPVCQI